MVSTYHTLKKKTFYEMGELLMGGFFGDNNFGFILFLIFVLLFFGSND